MANKNNEPTTLSTTKVKMVLKEKFSKFMEEYRALPLRGNAWSIDHGIVVIGKAYLNREIKFPEFMKKLGIKDRQEGHRRLGRIQEYIIETNYKD